MNILVINGDCVQVNTSANLCHLAYIRGMVDAGHRVTLLSADSRDYTIDPAMEIPAEVICHTYNGVSLYEKLSLKKNRSVSPAAAAPSPGGTARSRRRLVRRVKDFALSLYGVHGIYIKFVKKASRFRSNEEYDCVISLSTPVTSHLLAHDLIESGHIRTRHWIQIWEDPWYSDAFGFNGRKEVFNEERRLLSFAEKVCYVSPITLENQKKLFPEAADKMFWQPLPAYYKTHSPSEEKDRSHFGYFGDYYPTFRDLKPFYTAALEAEIDLAVCGNPHTLFSPTDHIRIYPRLPLDQLNTIEDQTGVLVFLCNKAGGQIPGKIYQYSATNKMILFILDGTEEEKKTIREYFEPFDRFVFCENTVEDIKQAMSSILRGELGDIKNVPLTDFEPKKIVQRILEEGMKQ